MIREGTTREEAEEKLGRNREVANKKVADLAVRKS